MKRSKKHLIKRKCQDCYKEYKFSDDTVLVICKCGGLVYDKEEENGNR